MRTLTRTHRRTPELPSRSMQRLVWRDGVCVGRDGREVGRVLDTGHRWIARTWGERGWGDLVLDTEQEAREAVEQSAARSKGGTT